MKLKITIWLNDIDSIELTDNFKKAIHSEIVDYFINSGQDIEVKQIEIEETEFED